VIATHGGPSARQRDVDPLPLPHRVLGFGSKLGASLGRGGTDGLERVVDRASERPPVPFLQSAERALDLRHRALAAENRPLGLFELVYGRRSGYRFEALPCGFLELPNGFGHVHGAVVYGPPLEAAMTRAISIISAIDIFRPPQAVWPYLVDWEHLDRWMKEARDFKVIGEQREGVGVEAEAAIRIAGITTRDRVRVTRWEPPAVLEITHLGWVKGTGYMELSPTDEGCTVFWREELYPPWGPIGRLGLRLVTPTMHHVFQRDLGLLKKLAESESQGA
jgi:uncharacterized protein YndB with AHSA1/START domain